MDKLRSYNYISSQSVSLASDSPKKRAGRKKFRETRHPVYRGVRRRGSGKWVCEVREPNKKTRIWLGTFASSHDVAAIALRGRSACLNFTDSTWRLPVAQDIRKAAKAEAEEEEEWFVDEEEVFGMHGLVSNLAEGLMLPPPFYFDDVDIDADVALWSYSLMTWILQSVARLSLHKLLRSILSIYHLSSNAVFIPIKQNNLLSFSS